MSRVMAVINTPVNFELKYQNEMYTLNFPDRVELFSFTCSSDMSETSPCTFCLGQSTLFSFVCFCLDPERCNLATDWWRGSLSQTDSRPSRLSLFDLESSGNLDRPVLWWAVGQRTSGSNSNCVHVCCSKICISDETWPRMHPGIRYHCSQTAL